MQEIILQNDDCQEPHCFNWLHASNCGNTCRWENWLNDINLGESILKPRDNKKVMVGFFL